MPPVSNIPLMLLEALAGGHGKWFQRLKIEPEVITNVCLHHPVGQTQGKNDQLGTHTIVKLGSDAN
jgi:hypothetical protein